jgi:hypothetical protein
VRWRPEGGTTRAALGPGNELTRTRPARGARPRTGGMSEAVPSSPAAAESSIVNPGSRMPPI